MATSDATLRKLIDHWLQPGEWSRVRVRQFGRTSSERIRFVFVEMSRSSGSVGLFFFRQPDRTWAISPPTQQRPSMRICSAS